MGNKGEFTYQKGQGKLECLTPIKKEGTSETILQGREAHTIEGIPPLYSKSEGVLSYSIVCVISGGTVRERDFLAELERKHTFKKLDVVFISTDRKEGGLTPRMMQDKFSDLCRDGKIGLRGRSVQLSDVDSVYMLTDVDHYEEELKSILTNQADNNHPKWIISNPCFEMWIYYCFRNNPEEELAGIISEPASSRSSRLKTIMGGFNNGGGLDPRKAFEHLPDGISHSKCHYMENEGIPTLLSTQMHIFAEDVLLKLDDEYHLWIQKKREFLKKYSKK